jgi:hypothetical protein
VFVLELEDDEPSVEELEYPWLSVSDTPMEVPTLLLQLLPTVLPAATDAEVFTELDWFTPWLVLTPCDSDVFAPSEKLSVWVML